MEPSATNVLAVLRSIDPTSLAQSRSWYVEANATACQLDFSDPTRAAAVLAVLSPMVRWWVNVRLAREAYAANRAGMSAEAYVDSFPGLKGSARKVASLLWDRVEPSSVFGPSSVKTRAFWQAIVDPSDASAVVIDRHAYDIAVGLKLTDDTRPKLKGKRYAVTVLAYVEAAKRYNADTGDSITPVEVQSATWVQWRETVPMRGGKK